MSQSGSLARSLAPVWMARVLLTLTVPSLMLMVHGGWFAFFENSADYIRFVDRAMSWMAFGLGGESAWGMLAATAGFALVVVCRRRLRDPIPESLRWSGFVVVVFFAMIELSGPVTLAVGIYQLVTDPTSARNLSTEMLSDGPPAVLCLTLAGLLGLLAWVLWHAGPVVEPEAPIGSASDEVPSQNSEVADRELRDVFRRPSR